MERRQRKTEQPREPPPTKTVDREKVRWILENMQVAPEQSPIQPVAVKPKSKGSAGWLAFLFVLIIAVLGYSLMSRKTAVVEPIAENPQSVDPLPLSPPQPTSMPALEPRTAPDRAATAEIRMDQRIKPEETAVPVAKVVDIAGFETSIGKYLIEGVGKTEALDAAKTYQRLNPQSAEKIGSDILAEMKKKSFPYPINSFQRYGEIAENLNPDISTEISDEIKRISKEKTDYETRPTAAPTARPTTRPTSQPKTENKPSTPVIIDFKMLFGLGISPIAFRQFFLMMADEQDNTLWKVTKVASESVGNIAYYDISLQDTKNSSRNTWLKGLYFLGSVKEGDIISGKLLLKVLFP